MALADLDRRTIAFPIPVPLLDGAVPSYRVAQADADTIVWTLDDGGSITLTCAVEGEAVRLDVTVTGRERPPASLGLRFDGITGVRRYLRNGYQSWDGSYFVAPGTPCGDGPPGKAPTLGFAMTALLPIGAGALVVGADRHDRFQTRLRFGGSAEAMRLDVETLLDGTGEARTESLFLFDGDTVEDTLRRWSRRVAQAAPTPPRVPEQLNGWCSWYNLYAAIDEGAILDHLAAAKAYRGAHGVPLEIFQIDDGFTPEMGDWLDVKPQFPRGMAPLLADVAAAGFRPGLWIAPFLVGNRSRLYAAHPDWVVRDVTTDGPLIAMQFYGEFRWHKRSEEYYILDITRPAAAAYLANVFRTWVGWGARYIKADFLYHGMEHGPERARWHEAGLSRVAIWRRMMTLIRDAVGTDVIVSGCGCPLWAGVGLVDTVRIGRDVGVTWHGDYSAESLLRDLQGRNHANGVLWRADPDCILLRDRFHELSDAQVEALARFAGSAGGVIMTSDKLDELPASRAALFAELLSLSATACDFPELGNDGPVVVQRVRNGNGPIAVNRFDLLALEGGL